jgi:parallel beta-helix repeat protein
MNTLQRRTGALLVALLLSVLMPGAALAASGRTVYVDDTGQTSAATSGRCGRPNYATIQAAVNDTSAGRVVVCKGIYVEIVTVERSLTLEGRSGAVIQAPAGDAVAVVQFRGPQQSRLYGFTITGAGANVAAGVRTNGFVCEDTPCGPTQVWISHNQVSDIYSSGAFGVSGIGIFIFQSQADVSDNTVERYGRAGIVADGDDRADTSAQIDGNIIRGQGISGTSESQIGIHLDETSADVEDNTISGNYGSGANGVGMGILVDFANSSIRDNTLKQNDTGVHLGPGDGAVLRSNVIRSSAHNGIELFSTINATIVENKSSNNGGSGIYLASNTQSTMVKANTARNNGDADIFDSSGPPPANTYIDNRCDISSPSGLCR